jgi:hypothetical protein
MRMIANATEKSKEDKSNAKNEKHNVKLGGRRQGEKRKGERRKRRKEVRCERKREKKAR